MYILGSLKKIPFILVHLNQEIPLAKELEIIESTGTIPYCIIFLTKLKEKIPTDLSIPAVWADEKNISKRISETVLNIRHSSIDFDQIIIYKDDTSANEHDILQGIYFSVYEPEAFHIIEREISIQKQPRTLMWMTEKIFGTRLDEPDPYLWIVPKKAVMVLSEKSNGSGFFPLTWLNICHKENIPIRVSFLDKTTERYHGHRFINQYLVLFYSLGLFFRYLLSASVGLIADNAMFVFLNMLGQNHLCSLIFARIFSMLINYSLLRIIVFREKSNHYGSLIRYIALVIFSGAIVWLSLEIGSKYLAIPSIFIKMSVEFVMFFFNYFVSKKFVFAKKIHFPE